MAMRCVNLFLIPALNPIPTKNSFSDAKIVDSCLGRVKFMGIRRLGPYTAKVNPMTHGCHIRAAFTALAVLCLASGALPALAQSSTDAFNFENITIDSSSSTLDGFEIGAIFGATVTGEDGTRTIFVNGDGTPGPNFVVFTIAAPVTLSGVTLYTISDGGAEDASRGTDGFFLTADINNDNAFDAGTEGLVSGVNPLDTGAPNVSV